MKTIVDFLTSETFGFVLKLFSGLAAAGFGMLGIGTKTREDNGRLTRNGRIALIGIIVAGLLAIGTNVYEFATSQKKTKEASEKSERLMLSVQRGLYPLHGMKVMVEILIDDSFVGVKEYKSAFKARIVRNRFCINQDEALRCKAISGPHDEVPPFYQVPLSSGLFPARNTILFAGINQMFIKFTAFKASPAPKKASGITYEHLGYPFKLYWTDRLPANTSLIYDVSRDELMLHVGDVELNLDSVASAGVYSPVDFMPGMMAVSIDFDPRDVCDEAKVEIEDCQTGVFGPLLKAFSISALSMMSPYAKGMSMRSVDDIQCQLFSRKYLAQLFTGDIDSDSWFSSERSEPYTQDQKNAACAAIDASIPKRERYNPGDPIIFPSN